MMDYAALAEKRKALAARDSNRDRLTKRPDANEKATAMCGEPRSQTPQTCDTLAVVTVRKLGLICTAVALSSACERDPLECPTISPGALVITEISSGPSDGLGEWIELFNASGDTIAMLGLRIELTTLDGGQTQELTVRRALSVAPSAYVTLGRFPDNDRPEHIDYGYTSDLNTSLLSRAAVQVVVCGDEVDQAIYRDLPATGSLALDGAMTPSAVENDVEANFCIDAVGTPREENQPCN